MSYLFLFQLQQTVGEESTPIADTVEDMVIGDPALPCTDTVQDIGQPAQPTTSDPVQIIGDLVHHVIDDPTLPSSNHIGQPSLVSSDNVQVIRQSTLVSGDSAQAIAEPTLLSTDSIQVTDVNIQVSFKHYLVIPVPTRAKQIAKAGSLWSALQ